MNEFLEKNLNSVVLGDCLELIKNLDDKSIDVCFTSPPYNSLGNEEIKYNIVIKNIYNKKCGKIG